MIRSVLPIAVVGLVLAGCTSKTPGEASSSGGATTTTTSAAPTTTSASSGGDKLANFDPCAELNAVASQFSLTRVEKKSAEHCAARWGQTTTAVGIIVFPSLGVTDVVPGANTTTTDTKVGSRQTKRLEKATTTTDCAFAVEVTPKSRVDFFASTTGSSSEACDVAKQLAEAVEPKLPK